MPGDPCPHCGAERGIKYNGGNPFCTTCMQLVDEEHPRVVLPAKERAETDRTRSEPAISWMAQGGDGPSLGWDNAKIECPRCPGGWKALECPHGCGVRLVSTAAEDLRAWRERMDAEEAARREYRAQRKREREARA